MKLMLIAIVLLAGCSGPTPGERIASLEAERAAIHADLVRQQAECQAQAIEFASLPNGQQVVLSCLEAYRALAESSNLVVEALDKRIAEIQREQLKNNPFNRFDERPKLIPFDGKLDGEK